MPEHDAILDTIPPGGRQWAKCEIPTRTLVLPDHGKGNITMD